MKYARNLKIQQ